jgi:hypothetical protein
MFVRLIRMVGLIDTGVIMVQAPPEGATSSLGECSMGLIVGGTSLGRERVRDPSL